MKLISAFSILVFVSVLVSSISNIILFASIVMVFNLIRCFVAFSSSSSSVFVFIKECVSFSSIGMVFPEFRRIFSSSSLFDILVSISLYLCKKSSSKFVSFRVDIFSRRYLFFIKYATIK